MKAEIGSNFFSKGLGRSFVSIIISPIILEQSEYAKDRTEIIFIAYLRPTIGVLNIVVSGTIRWVIPNSSESNIFLTSYTAAFSQSIERSHWKASMSQSPLSAWDENVLRKLLEFARPAIHNLQLIWCFPIACDHDGAKEDRFFLYY